MINMVHVAAPYALGAISVTSTAISGYEAGGTAVGVVGAIIAAVTLALTISANNRKKRKEYEDEMQEAYDRGKADQAAATVKAEQDAAFYRDRYFNLAERRGVQAETPAGRE